MSETNSKRDKENPKSDPDFLEWISGYLKGFSIAAFIFVGLNVVVPFLDKVKDQMIPILYGIQAIFIVVIIGVILFGKKPKIDEDQHFRGSKAVMQFWRWWPLLWLVWFFLYALLTLANIFFPEKSFGIDQDVNIFNMLRLTFVFTIKILIQDWTRVTIPYIQVILHIVNNIATVVLVMFFYFLASPSVTGKDEKKKGEKDPVKPSALFMFGLLIIAVFVLVEISCLKLSGADKTSQIINVFGIFYGVLAAAATALVVGRLDSLLLGIPKPAIVTLFLYAAIQPTFDFLIRGQLLEFDPAYIFKALIIAFALVSKIVLFAVLQWLAMSGRLLYFMEESKEMFDNVKDRRMKFIKKLEKKKAPLVRQVSSIIRKLCPWGKRRDSR